MKIDFEPIKANLIHRLGGYTQADMDAEKAKRAAAVKKIAKYVESTLKWENRYWELKKSIVPLKVGIIEPTRDAKYTKGSLLIALMERFEPYVTFGGDGSYSFAEISVVRGDKP